MRRTTSFKLLGLSALFLFVIGCVTWVDQNKQGERSREKAIGVRVIKKDCPPAQDTRTACPPVQGIRLDACLELVPYIARVWKGDTVIWYAPDGELNIEFIREKAGAGPRPLRNPPCEKRGGGSTCELKIDRDQPSGTYPYCPHVRIPDGGVYRLNQGEVDIKP